MMKLTRVFVLVVLLTLTISACSVAKDDAIVLSDENLPVSGQANDAVSPDISSNTSEIQATVQDVPQAEENMGDEVNEKGIVVITPGITGASAKVKVGDIIEVRIPTIPTEGFQWMPDRLNTSALEQVGLAEYTADTAADSAGGIVSLRFKALAPGTVNVTLIYTNAGSGKDPALTKNTFGFELTIE